MIINLLTKVAQLEAKIFTALAVVLETLTTEKATRKRSLSLLEDGNRTDTWWHDNTANGVCPPT